MSQRPTVKLCSARYDESSPNTVRCVLPANHDPGVPHEGIGPDGKPLRWKESKKAPAKG